MRCDDIAGRLMDSGFLAGPEVQAHLAGCTACDGIARTSVCLDRLLPVAVVAEPPAGLQAQLRFIALRSAAPARVAVPASAGWWDRLLGALGLDGGGDVPRLALSQAFAVLVLALASWQALPWIQNLHPIIGDVPYAVEIIASSPVVAYVGGGTVDLSSLLFWGSVGLLGFTVSDRGPLGQLLSGRVRSLA